MITGADRAVLNESYKNSKMRLQAIDTIISKVYDEDLALDLNRQAAKYRNMEEKAASRLLSNGVPVDAERTLDKAVRWTSMQANTILNTSTEHVAEMMIQENTSGITDLLKTVKYNKGASKEAYEIAEELMDFEEKNIQKLKSYLK